MLSFLGGSSSEAANHIERLSLFILTLVDARIKCSMIVNDLET
jgi:hypothetical protein